MVLVVKNPSANAGDTRDTGSIPGLGRSPGGGHSNPLQYSFLENPMDRGDWWATAHRVTKSQTRLKRLSSSSSSKHTQRGFPGGASSKEPACQCGRRRFHPLDGKIPWRRKWQPTPVFFPGESHGQRSLTGSIVYGVTKESDLT